MFALQTLQKHQPSAMSDDDGRERELQDAPVLDGDREAAPAREAPTQQFKCFVGGISWHLDDTKLREGARSAMSQPPAALRLPPQPTQLTPRTLRTAPAAAFAEFHPVDAVVMMDKMTGRSRGFGFIFFGNKADQDAAIDRMHNTEVDGRRISVNRAVPQAETAPGTPADALRKGEVVPRDAGRVGGYRCAWRSGDGCKRGAGLLPWLLMLLACIPCLPAFPGAVT